MKKNLLVVLALLSFVGNASAYRVTVVNRTGERVEGQINISKFFNMPAYYDFDLNPNKNKSFELGIADNIAGTPRCLESIEAHLVSKPATHKRRATSACYNITVTIKKTSQGKIKFSW